MWKPIELLDALVDTAVSKQFIDGQHCDSYLVEPSSCLRLFQRIVTTCMHLCIDLFIDGFCSAWVRGLGAHRCAVMCFLTRLRLLLEAAGPPVPPSASEEGAPAIIFPGQAALLAAALAEEIIGSSSSRGVTGISKKNARAIAAAIRKYLLPYEDIFKNEFGKKIGRFLAKEIPSWQSELNPAEVRNITAYFGQYKDSDYVPQPCTQSVILMIRCATA